MRVCEQFIYSADHCCMDDCMTHIRTLEPGGLRRPHVLAGTPSNTDNRDGVPTAGITEPELLTLGRCSVS